MMWSPYSESLRADCVRIVESVVPDYVAPHEVDDFTRFLDGLEEWGCRYGVVETDDAVIACGGLAIEGTVATMCWGLVRADWHARRVGTFMLLERLRWAQATPEVLTVNLQTTQRTFRFFEKFGFETVRVRGQHFTAELDAYDMVKRRPF